MRVSSELGAMGTRLAPVRPVPSTGQKPASFGNVRWHWGQIFMEPSALRDYPKSGALAKCFAAADKERPLALGSSDAAIVAGVPAGGCGGVAALPHCGVPFYGTPLQLLSGDAEAPGCSGATAATK